MATPSGQMRHPVGFYAPSITDDAAGQPVKTYPSLTTTRWCKIKPTESEERVIAEAYEGRTQLKFSMRNDLTDDATSFMDYRLVYRGRNFHPIGEINPMELSAFRELVCVEDV